MRIEIRKRADKGHNVPVVYEVRVVGPDMRKAGIRSEIIYA
jgi:hypothetical protein